jgi:hypothetical protein
MTKVDYIHVWKYHNGFAQLIHADKNNLKKLNLLPRPSQNKVKFTDPGSKDFKNRS